MKIPKLDRAFSLQRLRYWLDRIALFATAYILALYLAAIFQSLFITFNPEP